MTRAINKTPRKEASFRRLETMLPRQKLIEVLQPSGDPRVQLLLECLLSTKQDMMERSLPALAAICKLTYAELIREVAKANVSEGILRMSKHLPQVLEDTAKDALSTRVMCANCKGTGEILGDKPHLVKEGSQYVKCPECFGKGTFRKAGNTEARRLVFESAGLTNKRVPAVNVNFKPGSGAVPSMESEMVALDRVLDIQPVKESA